ncbi:hypothetical protein [Streptomyces formicae]|uniref:Uncharacterized protein n=1 Tax=Streptomyces formicae TaxID=1616117 RepID=A0A291QCS9_9ACTN|nr:hypothetical protein [Streptomyces formicae]ATL29255.1 hypothetical protein KY5_4237c [Streptomyces formicae]
MADETSRATVSGDGSGDGSDSEFQRIRYLGPYLLFVTANAGTSRVSLSERPFVFWVFVACAVLGVVTTVACLKSMKNSRTSRGDGQRQHRPAYWPDFWGTLLVLYALYVTGSVINHAT